VNSLGVLTTFRILLPLGSLVVRTRRAVVAATGALVLSVLLAGCFDVRGELTVAEDGAITGVQTIEIPKQVVNGLGVTSLDGLQRELEREEEFADGSSVESDDDCPSELVYRETDAAYVIECVFTDALLTTGDLTAARVGESVVLSFRQEGEDAGDPDSLGLGTSGIGAGSVELVMNFPGPIESIAGGTPAKATKVDADTVRITGTAFESYDLQITSAATGGTNPAPESVAAANAADSGDGFPWVFVISVAVVLAAVLAVVALVLALVFGRRKRSAEPVGVAPGEYAWAAPGAQAASGAPSPFAPPSPPAPPVAPSAAPPGWYPNPLDPSGAPRYWDGVRWLEG
jgi:hypothetical protein